ncbi:MAG: 2-oxo-tetronate isomerase [Alphaproteobacteria bacterium]
MKNFAANLSMLFTEYDFLDRFAKASQYGFSAVEYLFPFDYDAILLQKKLQENNLIQEIFNLYPGNWDKGDRGLAALAHRQSEFDASLHQGLHYAQMLNCKKIHIMAGLIETSTPYESYEETYIANMQKAADFFAPHKITLLIEPLNTYSMPNYFIAHQSQGAELIQKINRSNVRLQFDLFHAQMMDGNITQLLMKYQDIIGHIQIASIPNRHEPHLEEINFRYFYELIQSINYQGAIGLEYNPRTTTKDGLDDFCQYMEKF